MVVVVERTSLTNLSAVVFVNLWRFILSLYYFMSVLNPCSHLSGDSRKTIKKMPLFCFSITRRNHMTGGGRGQRYHTCLYEFVFVSKKICEVMRGGLG